MPNTPWLGPRTRSSPQASRRRWRSVWPAACSALLVVAGCGGSGDRRVAEPRIPAPVAQRLSERSDRVAADLARGSTCAANREAEALRADAVSAVRGGDVPAVLRAQLLRAVTQLGERIACEPPPAPPPVSPPAPPKKAKEHEGKNKEKGGSEPEPAEPQPQSQPEPAPQPEPQPAPPAPPPVPGVTVTVPTVPSVP